MATASAQRWTLPAGARRWYLLHKWSSLICTAFLLVLCVTGLPLVFRDEIEAWTGDAPPYAQVPPGTPRANIDAMVLAARGPQGLYPGEIVRWISIEDDKPEVWIALAPSYEAERKRNHVLKFDAYTGQLRQSLRPPAAARITFIGVVHKLHTELLMGEAGEWLLAGMGLLFVLATVSGVALYGPIMKRLAFGTLRRERGARIRWLDAHNLLGIATLAWMGVVGITGVLNEIADPLYDHWRTSTLASMQRPFAGLPMPTETSSTQAAIDTVAQALPGMRIRSLRYPDALEGSPHHYLIWTIGNTPLTARLFQPALVDARSGQLTMVAQPPWYLLVVQISRPLHFGDYGGTPLKILWALLDLATIVVLVSGLYLWFARRAGRA